MKILLVHNSYKLVGGAEFFYREVGRVLTEAGHRVAFFSGADETTRDLEYGAHFPAWVDHRNQGVLGTAMRLPRMIYSREAKRQAAKVIEDFKPDVLHAFATYSRLSPSVLDAAREAGVPAVMSCNDYKHICPNYKLYHHGHLCEDCKGGRFYMAAVNSCAHQSFAHSVGNALEAYVHHYLDIYRKNIHTFLFASEFMARKTEEFWGAGSFRWRKLLNPFDAAGQTHTGEFGDYILYFGRLIDEKGVDVLVRAASLVPHVRIKIVGDGPDEAMLRRLAGKVGAKNIEFLGSLWGPPLDEVLTSARFVVVPSLWNENFPYVILQAFAAGKAVIGTDRGGIPELVRDGEFGYIYPARDEAALAERIADLWEDPQKFQGMGAAAKKYVDAQFNDKTFHARLMEIYEAVRV